MLFHYVQTILNNHGDKNEKHKLYIGCLATTEEIFSSLSSSKNLNAGFGDPDEHEISVTSLKKREDDTHNNVSSNCALRLPSTVVAVQLSGQWIKSQLVPKFNMGSIVNV